VDAPDAPLLDPDTSWFLNTFAILSAARQGGFGPSPLAIADLVLYWRQVARIGPLAEFITVMQAVDRLWLDWQREQMDKDKPKG